MELENGIIKMLVRKNRRMLEVPLEFDKALSVVKGWHGIRKSDIRVL